MLGGCRGRELVFEDQPSRNLPFAVVDPEVEILDEMSARLTARFVGPPGSQVVGRAWISDMDGTIVDGETGVIAAGSEQEILLTIPEARPQNGDLIACMRVEWPLYQTKYVIQCGLVDGEIIHPPKGKPC